MRTIGTVAARDADIGTVAASDAAINNVANNLASVNNFGDTYFVSATAPSNPTIGDLWFDSSSNTMKVYGFVWVPKCWIFCKWHI